MSQVEHLTDELKDVGLGCAAEDSQTATGDNPNIGASDASQRVNRIKLVSGNGESFMVEENVARKLKFDDATIVGAIEGDKPIPVENIKSDILTIMIKWAEKHVTDQEADDSEDEDDDEIEVKRTDDIDEWDNELLSLDIPTLFRLLKVARQREIHGLFTVTAKKSASMFKNKTVEELRETLNGIKDVSKTDA